MPALSLHHEHDWNLSAAEARRIQENLRGLVVQEPFPERDVRRVGGVDAAFLDGAIVAAAVVVDYDDLKVIESATVQAKISFPYVPGLLSFREAPAILQALARLSALPDVILVDGHGIAHPRRFGLACHLGVLLDLPSIGCGKSILVGQAEEPGLQRGSRSALVANGEQIGAVLRTRDGVRPIYVSAGHRADLEAAVRLVLKCGNGYRLPEPTRQADLLAGRAKRDILQTAEVEE